MYKSYWSDNQSQNLPSEKIKSFIDIFLDYDTNNDADNDPVKPVLIVKYLRVNNLR